MDNLRGDIAEIMEMERLGRGTYAPSLPTNPRLRKLFMDKGSKDRTSRSDASQANVAAQEAALEQLYAQEAAEQFGMRAWDPVNEQLSMFSPDSDSSSEAPSSDQGPGAGAAGPGASLAERPPPQPQPQGLPRLAAQFEAFLEQQKRKQNQPTVDTLDALAALDTLDILDEGANGDLPVFGATLGWGLQPPAAAPASLPPQVPASLRWAHAAPSTADPLSLAGAADLRRPQARRARPQQPKVEPPPSARPKRRRQPSAQRSSATPRGPSKSAWRAPTPLDDTESSVSEAQRELSALELSEAHRVLQCSGRMLDAPELSFSADVAAAGTAAMEAIAGGAAAPAPPQASRVKVEAQPKPAQQAGQSPNELAVQRNHRDRATAAGKRRLNRAAAKRYRQRQKEQLLALEASNKRLTEAQQNLLELIESTRAAVLQMSEQNQAVEKKNELLSQIKAKRPRLHGPDKLAEAQKKAKQLAFMRPHNMLAITGCPE